MWVLSSPHGAAEDLLLVAALSLTLDRGGRRNILFFPATNAPAMNAPALKHLLYIQHIGYITAESFTGSFHNQYTSVFISDAHTY